MPVSVEVSGVGDDKAQVCDEKDWHPCQRAQPLQCCANAPHKRHVHVQACPAAACALAQASRRRRACLFYLRSTIETLFGGPRVSHQAAIHFSVFALGYDLLLIFIGFVKWYILRHIIYCGFKYPAKDEINCRAV